MTTLVLGASLNPERYSNRAIKLLRRYRHEVIAVGLDEGKVDGVEIVHDLPKDEKIDTVTVYLNPERQKAYYERILKAKPRRIIFNPGAENAELESLAEQNGIMTEEACTLVMLNAGQY